MTREQDYHARRHARRRQIKAALLVALRRCVDAGERPDMAALAIRFRCAVSGLRAMRHELAAEGLVADPEAARLKELTETPLPDLAARVAKVRAAKLAIWRDGRRTCLTEAELAEVLP